MHGQARSLLLEWSVEEEPSVAYLPGKYETRVKVPEAANTLAYPAKILLDTAKSLRVE
jgi:hypothetical protein